MCYVVKGKQNISFDYVKPLKISHQTANYYISVFILYLVRIAIAKVLRCKLITSFFQVLPSPSPSVCVCVSALDKGIDHTATYIAHPPRKPAPFAFGSIAITERG